MKIVVLIPSRTAPFKLQDTLHAARSLESGRHDVRYVVGVDHDDPNTLAMCTMLTLQSRQYRYRVFKRMSSLGHMSNIMAAENPADCYCSLGNDTVPVTPGWDEAVHKAWSARPDGVFWWHGCECPIVSHKWMKAAGYLYTDFFPFWWDDNWLIQLWAMASDGPQLFIDGRLEDKPLATLRMRDLRFWTEFYGHMKPYRQKEAARIATALGWPVGSLEDDTGDVKDHFWKVIEDVERAQGDKEPPTEAYRIAKERAERLMAA
jgi:hypothetical protein